MFFLWHDVWVMEVQKSSPCAPCDRVVLIVMDSCGCGAAPDAAAYGDAGSNTLAHTAQVVKGLHLPVMTKLGLGHITDIQGVPPVMAPHAAYGRLREQSRGKDTTTGHWELTGLQVDHAFPTFPQGFPKELLEQLERVAGRALLGNKPASGTAILEELGATHLQTGALIVYTSADSVLQIAAHEEIVPLEELYRIGLQARRLCDAYGIGRVIVRPFVGQPGSFQRTYNRKDFSLLPPEPTVLTRISEAGLPVVGVGKIHDIFAGQGVTDSVHSEGNLDGMRQTIEAFSSLSRGLVFCNLVDFDMLYGHRRDPRGYARALEEIDSWVGSLWNLLQPRDVVLLTADHGNDPTFPGSDHTREDVPILAFSKDPAKSPSLGVRNGFFDVAQTLCQAFELPPWPRGKGFLASLFNTTGAEAQR